MFGIKRKYETETWKDYLLGHVLWCLGGRALTFWWQRRTRGFDDSELWSLDYTMCKFMAPRLRALQEMVNGYPSDLLYGENFSEEAFQAFHALPVEEQQRRSAETMALWKEMLGKMARAMELWVENDTWLEDDQKREWEEGMELFHKYLFGLWD
jgi:hypothetical protein